MVFKNFIPPAAYFAVNSLYKLFKKRPTKKKMLKIISASIVILLSANLYAQTLKDSASVNKSSIEIDDKIFEKVEREAAFPGGAEAWTQYLQVNLKADVPIKKKAPAGTYKVIVKFIVAKNGKVKEIMAETTYGFGMEKEVIRIIKKGPNWLPAMQDGHAVNAYRRQPITFLVSEE